MKAMIYKFIACMAIIVMVSTVCTAQSDRTDKMEIGASLLFLGGESVSFYDVKIEEDDWNMYGFTLGKNINEHLNLNTEFVFGNVDVDVSGLPANVSIDGDQDTFIWLVNVDYNILDEPLTPYITAGLGYGYSEAEVKYTETTPTGTLSGKITEEVSGLAYTVGVGGRWDATENIFAKVAYRIIWDDEGDDRSGLGVSVGFLF
jgi:opacity protein-like surface antigen